ncbi:MAG: 4-hydroxythreonine-4-phosphate dehydrogenase PdxA [candidate division WOR-3 bacterium]
MTATPEGKGYWRPIDGNNGQKIVLVVVVTLGEITGIGPEVVLKAIAKFPPQEVKIIGARVLLTKLREKLKIAIDFEPYLLDFLPGIDFTFGKPDRKTAQFAWEGLKVGVSLIKKGEAKGIVTAPISKSNLYRIGFPYPGQTEFFAQEFGVRNYCFLAYHKKIKVAFLTLHCPLKEVPSWIKTRSVVEKGLLLYDFLHRLEGIESPRIGLFSLNPHGGEFSRGEEKEMAKGIKRLKDLGIDIVGTLPADSFLFYYKRYDGFISPYHDQGMIMVKTIGKGKGINTTLGLPFIRTSPLHGTAFDIAGKGVADSRGMEEAIRLCRKWAKEMVSG